MFSYKIFNDNAEEPFRSTKAPRPVYKNLCFLSALIAFSIGLTLGLLVPFFYLKKPHIDSTLKDSNIISNNLRNVLINNSFSAKNATTRQLFNSVSFVNDKEVARFDRDGAIIQDGIFWGSKIESSLPKGYHNDKHELWSKYLQEAVAVKLENGCGRMQNRLVVFQDGVKGCVRYRQNTDQIQGELFSFYLAQLLGLPNLVPSAVSVVDLKLPLWDNLRNEIAAAQWNSNRAIVVTQFISDLGSANIPEVFKPNERHLNKFDIANITRNNVLEDGDVMNNLIELAQWSDLIIFDYLTANLDRIVNNLYNYQWNVNIMDAPAHNLAKKPDNNLLVFLDNESGLLHGYRLLKKYEVYHSLLLENLCVFRKPTVDILKELKTKGNVGNLLRGMFEERNSETVKDILPTLPDKSVKILNERIERVYNQIIKCESKFSKQFVT